MTLGDQLIRKWEGLRSKPGGRWLFSKMIGLMVPYSGTIGARVEALRPGHATLVLRDRRKVRNHLRSVHAIALANLGELTTGLAMLSGLPPKTRGILRGIDVVYEKKARGRLVSTCDCEMVAPTENTEVKVRAEIRDASGEVVTVVTALWVVGPEKAERAEKVEKAEKANRE